MNFRPTRPSHYGHKPRARPERAPAPLVAIASTADPSAQPPAVQAPLPGFAERQPTVLWTQPLNGVDPSAPTEGSTEPPAEAPDEDAAAAATVLPGADDPVSP